jgi:hypothetical protein
MLFRPAQGIASRFPRQRCIHVQTLPDRFKKRNLFRSAALFRQMNSDLSTKAATENSMDRRIIRVELPPAHAGVTAALRRAFAAVPPAPAESEFDELLSRLG